MDGIFLLIALCATGIVSRHLLRIYLTVKHPKVRDAWDEAEERRDARRKKLAGGAVKAGLGVAKILLKK